MDDVLYDLLQLFKHSPFHRYHLLHKKRQDAYSTSKSIMKNVFFKPDE